MSKKLGFLSFLFLIGELSRQPREAAGVCAVTLLGLHLLATSKVVMLQTLQIGARWLPVLSGHSCSSSALPGGLPRGWVL